MFHRIIVGHDHKAGGQDALALGRLLARTSGAELLLAGVIPVGMMPADVEMVWRDEEHDYADKISTAAADSGAEARVFHSHSVAKGLTDLAHERAADLIVVGSSRRGKASQILAGNIALQVLHGAPCAVMVAPVGYADDAPTALDSLVVGVGGAEESQGAAEAAAGLAAATGAKVTLVAVVEPPPLTYGKGGGMTGVHELEAAVKEQLQADLKQAAARFPADAQPDSELLEGEPAELLEKAAQGASMLVMGSRGYGPLGRTLLGVTDAKVLKAAPCPVMVWPRHAHASEPTGVSAVAGA